MSTYDIVKDKCAVCGAQRQHVVWSTSNAVGVDLDFRPIGMARDTMDTWAVECFECGYVSRRISDPTGISPEFLKSKEYRTCGGHHFKSELAEKFYRNYMILLAGEDRLGAAFALERAAWACDDARDTGNAVICRKLAIPFFEDVLENEEKLAALDNLTRVKVLFAFADFLRRTGQAEKLAEALGEQHFADEDIQKVVDFQLMKAKEGDTGPYVLTDANEDMVITMIVSF